MKSVSVLIVLAVIIVFSILKIKATDFSAPFLVSIQQREHGNSKHKCTGAIISPARILTAEACFDEGIEELYAVAGILYGNFKGKESKVVSYIVPEFNYGSNVNGRMAVLSINPPFHLDGKDVAKVNVDSDRIDAYSELLNGTFRVYLYFYSTEGVVRRLDMVPKSYKEGVEIMNKEMYLEFVYRYGDTGCNAEMGSSLGSPIIRDNELVGVVLVKEIDSASCYVATNAIAVRAPIFAYWIQDQITEEKYYKEEDKCNKDQVPDLSAPFLVSIQRFTPTGTLKHFCTGALIAPDLILTAAICLNRGIKKLVAVVGISNLADPLGQKRQILSYEASGSPDPLRQQIAVARVYPSFSTQKEDVRTIAVRRNMLCSDPALLQYLYGIDMIYISNYTRQPIDSGEEIDPLTAFKILPVEEDIFGDCPLKLGSFTGGPVTYKDEIIGVLFNDLDNSYCHLQTKKMAVPVPKWKKWIAQQMKMKVVEFDDEAKP